MQPAEFRAYHEPALETDEVKHGLVLSALARMVGETPAQVSYWTLRGLGECAIRMGHHSIVLGALNEVQCCTLAELTASSNYPGVVGPDLTANWFTDRAGKLGVRFLEPVPQQIYAISDKPDYPGALGHARPVTIADATLLANWLTTFHQEAVPHDPLPTREELEKPGLEPLLHKNRIYPGLQVPALPPEWLSRRLKFNRDAELQPTGTEHPRCPDLPAPCARPRSRLRAEERDLCSHRSG